MRGVVVDELMRAAEEESLGKKMAMEYSELDKVWSLTADGGLLKQIKRDIRKYHKEMDFFRHCSQVTVLCMTRNMQEFKHTASL